MTLTPIQTKLLSLKISRRKSRKGNQETHTVGLQPGHESIHAAFVLPKKRKLKQNEATWSKQERAAFTLIRASSTAEVSCSGRRVDHANTRVKNPGLAVNEEKIQVYFVM